jgi:hypothetical protein
MKEKKSLKSGSLNNAGAHRVHDHAGHGRKSTGQTEGQFARDPKGRKGQYGGAGDSPQIKK